MSEECGETSETSDLVEISKLNGDFRHHYGLILGAFLYLRSVSAARGSSSVWITLASLLSSAISAWIACRGYAR
jgi:hypothetical protein